MNKADVVSATGKNIGPLPSRTCNGVIQSDELQVDTKGKAFMKVSGRLRQGGMGTVTLGPTDKLHTGEGKRPFPCRWSHNSLETQELRMFRVPLVQKNRTNIRDGERENDFQQLTH